MHNCILLEVYCTNRNLNTQSGTSKCYCSDQVPGYGCLHMHCPYISFTSCENSLCYVNDKSVAQEIVSLGGEMVSYPSSTTEEISMWRDIAIKKINEAYNEYMKEKEKTTRMKTGDG